MKKLAQILKMWCKLALILPPKEVQEMKAIEENLGFIHEEDDHHQPQEEDSTHSIGTANFLHDTEGEAIVERNK